VGWIAELIRAAIVRRLIPEGQNRDAGFGQGGFYILCFVLLPRFRSPPNNTDYENDFEVFVKSKP